MDINEELHYGAKIISKLNACNKTLRGAQLKQNKKWDQERKQWDRERKQWESAFSNVNGEKQKLYTHTSELINETKRLKIENADLTSKNIRKELSITESNAENAIKSKKIRSLESIIKILESKLTLTQKDVISIQKDSSKKESEILSLKSKIAELENIKSELESKVNELEHLKSEAISKPVLGGNNEKNMTKSDDISAVLQSRPLGDSLNHDTYVSNEPSKNLSKYFVRGKSMDQTEKINNDISTYTNDEITELPKIDTEINPKVGDEISISETNKDNMLDISIKPNVSEVMPQIPIGAMRPSLEALSLPVMTSTLMSPLLAYIFLILLIIAVMWFMVLRRTWGFERKSDRLRDMWVK